MTYKKLPLTVDDQIALLRQRGMVIDDLDVAKHHLNHINYYRLRAYWLPFEQTGAGHRFAKETRLEDAIDLYTFDRRLRLLLMDATERLEVSFRTRWAHELALVAGSHAHLNTQLFYGQQQRVLQNVENEIHRSQETFIEHYRNTYSNPASPPIWATCEVMTFGQLSKSFDNIRDNRLKGKIADFYDLPATVYGSFLHQATYLRNLCAHHNRVWNKDFTLLFQLPRTKPRNLVQSLDRTADSRGNPQNRKLYNTLTTTVYLMEIVSQGSGWEQRLNDLLSENLAKLPDMGFPPTWRGSPIWKNLSL